MPGQGGVDADAGGDREQGGELAHGVGGRAEADVPLGGGVRGTLGDGARVEPVRGGPCPAGQGPVTHPVERAGVRGEVRVDGGPVRGGQAGGFAHEQGGAPFVELSGLQRGEGVRHFGDQGFGQAQEPAAPGRGFAPGEGDLRADPGAEFLGRDPGGGLLVALEQVEGGGVPGLPGCHGGLQVLQVPDFVDQCGGAVRSREEGQDPGQCSDRHSICRCRVCRNHFGPLIAVHESSVPAGYDIYGPPEPFHRFGSHRRPSRSESHSRNAAQENVELKTRQQCVDRRAQLVKLSVLFDYPGAILGLTHVPEHAGAECEQILEVVVTAPCH
ncbi:hypothetical protein SRABI26_03963 [Arthrobacter sp. Bi26]|nr:hypothetical protein SRABI26_03963 [Arthrobacter sp. Bi26]